MIRAGELLAFLLPAAMVILWRVAVLRGLDGPPPRQLAWIALGLLALGAGLGVLSLSERLPPGQYVPPHTVDGNIVPGHVEPGTAGPGHVVPGPRP